MNTWIEDPARLYALLFGAVLAVVGVVGFFYEGSFDTGDEVPADDLIGVFAVNGWHNVVHIASGLVGLAAAGAAVTARAFALGFGLVYLGVAIWGFVIGGGETILDFLIVNTADNWLHLGIALVGLAAFAASAGRHSTGSRSAVAASDRPPTPPAT